MRQRGKARLKRSVPREEAMVNPWTTTEDQYGKAAASSLPSIWIEA